jgi:hypothetical protein
VFDLIKLRFGSKLILADSVRLIIHPSVIPTANHNQTATAKQQDGSYDEDDSLVIFLFYRRLWYGVELF